MGNFTIKSFSSDLLNLYLKTRNRKVENLFITASTWFDKGVVLMHPSKWLKSNPGIKKTLHNSLVYDALIAMESLKDGLKGLNPQRMMSEIFKLSGQGKINISIVPIIQAFNSFLDDESIGEILDPYADIIKNLSMLPPVPGRSLQGEGEKEEIYSDLSTIEKEYSNAIEFGEQEEIKHIKVHKMDMFSNLLQKFSSELAATFQRANMPQVAQQISRGALTQPNVIGNVYPLAPITSYKSEMAQHIVDEVLRNYYPSSLNRNYEFIKDQVLSGIGMKPSVEEENEDVNVEQFMEADEGERQKHYREIMQRPEKTISMTDEQWLHQPVITLLTTIFYLMRKKIYAR